LSGSAPGDPVRALRLWARQRVAELRIARRRGEVTRLLEAHLGRPCRLRPAGAGGQDSVYTVHDERGAFASLRLVNPYLRRGRLAADMPFQSPAGPERIEREWSCYSQGAAHGLTPRPLWRAADALVCTLVPGERLADRVHAQPERFWDSLSAATAAIARLHEQGLTHMDASLANLIATPAGELVFVDFEYTPARGLTVQQQRVLDHLRLLETSLPLLPTGAAQKWPVWLERLDRSTDASARACDLAPLEPALRAVLAHEQLGPALRERFAR